MNNRITSLENLDKRIEENRQRQFGENMVKYQNFKTSVIRDRIDHAGFKEKTLDCYINSCIAYIKTGKKFAQYGKIYDYVDEALARHVQPLTPKEEDRRRILPPRSSKRVTSCIEKDKVPPVVNVLNQIKEINKPVYEERFGVITEDRVILMENEDKARDFQKSFKLLSNNDIDVIEIKIRKI